MKDSTRDKSVRCVWNSCVDGSLTIGHLPLHHGCVGGSRRSHAVIEVALGVTPALPQASRSHRHIGSGGLQREDIDGWLSQLMCQSREIDGGDGVHA